MRTTNTDNLKRTHKATVLNFRLSCYHLATKLWEGYVFTGVCHSVHRGVGTSNASWDSSDGRGYPLAPPPWTQCRGPPFGWHTHPSVQAPCYWHLVVTTGDLFKLVHFRTYPAPTPGVTSSGGNWNRKRYGFKVGGMHPTGMPSC